MAIDLPFFEGFGHYGTGTINVTGGDTSFAGKWASVSPLSSTQNPQLEDIGDGRCWCTNHAAGTTYQRFLTHDWTGQASMSAGVRVKLPTSSSHTKLVLFRDGASVLGTFGINSSNQLVYCRGNSLTSNVVLTITDPLTANIEYYVECEVTFHDSTGSVEIYLNGSSVGSATGVDTIGTGTTCDRVMFREENDQSVRTADFYIHSSRLGPQKCLSLFATTDGTETDWTPLGGGNNEAEVDETDPDEDTSYNYTSTNDDRDVFDFDTLAGVEAVEGVQVLVRARMDSGTIKINPLTKEGTDVEVAADQALGLTYQYHRAYFDDHPDGTSWTLAKVNSCEFGYELST